LEDPVTRTYAVVGRLALLAALVVSGAGLARAQGRMFQPSDIGSITDIAEVEMSPDGTTVAIVSTAGRLDDNSTFSRVLLVAGDGAMREPAGLPDRPNHLRWSPDGTRLAFFGSKDGRTGVWTLTVSSGAVARVSDYDRSNSFISRAGSWLAWSPDGTRLAFAGTLDPLPAPADPLVITRLMYKSRTAFSDNRRAHLFVVPASGGTPRPLTAGGFDEHSIDWGGDGREIVFLSNREADPDRRLDYDIYAVGVDSKAIRRITTTPGVEMEPRVSPDGARIAYLATTRFVTTIDSVAEDAHVFVVPFAGGPARELNHALDRRSLAVRWLPDSRSLVFTASDRGKVVLYRVDTEGGAPVALVDRAAQVGTISVAARTGATAFGLTDPLRPREVFRLDSVSGEPRALTRFNQAAIENRQMSEPETIAFRSFDGTAVEGWFYPPLRSGVRTPMVLSIHGGPHGMYGYAFSATFQIYAARGYGVLALNPRGSAGYGQRFSDGCVGDWGGGDYKDLMAGVDHVLATHPQIDGDRLAVMGGSYGGYMTNWIVTQTTRFKAAAASASLSNLASFYATSLYQDLVHAEFNGFPWEGANYHTLWSRSPLAWIRRVVTPTLLLHGEQDNDVHITQAEEMYTALRQRGIETILVRYPREGHGLREPKHQLDQIERTLAFFDRLVGGAIEGSRP
jgi:dipeptidyl aminopeptidase/acylaminoacyl peptidase